MKIKRLFLLLVMFYAVHTQAQIGYQISLLNTATGEPRANETVNVTVTLTNREGGIIYTGNQSATTNDFGVLSLTIGDADTFKEVDVTKMPFYVEVSANGVSIGKSQVLSVPVAEYAKRTGTLTKELLVGTWVREYSYQEKINSSYSVSHYDGEGNRTTEYIHYTFTHYHEYKSTITFNSDGSSIHSHIERRWSIGAKGPEGVPSDHESKEEDLSENEYIIDGNQVFFIIKDQGIIIPENAVITHVSSPHVTKWHSSMFYFDSIGMLGDGYTKR